MKHFKDGVQEYRTKIVFTIISFNTFTSSTFSGGLPASQSFLAVCKQLAVFHNEEMNTEWTEWKISTYPKITKCSYNHLLVMEEGAVCSGAQPEREKKKLYQSIILNDQTLLWCFGHLCGKWLWLFMRVKVFSKFKWSCFPFQSFLCLVVSIMF